MDIDYTKIPLVFNVYKPKGPSSFKIVYHFKKNLSYDFGKIGHFGTLDPFAEGVLMIGVQGAQRLNEYVHKLLPKTYRAVGIFGGKTESGDLTSPVSLAKEIDPKWQQSTQEEIEEFLAKTFLGEYWQSPHSVSAVKFEGKRLYQHALEGRFIEKEKVKREILEFSVISYEYPKMEFVVKVSSGTYVRSLFEECAELLGGVGALETLERVAIGENVSSDAIKETDWPLKGEPFNLVQWGKPIDKVLRLNHALLNKEQTYKYLQGQRFPMEFIEVKFDPHPEEIAAEELFWVYGHEGHLLGLARNASSEFQSIFNLTLPIGLYLNSPS